MDAFVESALKNLSEELLRLNPEIASLPDSSGRLEAALPLFVSYLKLLNKWSPIINLVSVRSDEELIADHLLDSAAASLLLDSDLIEGPIWDIGSGAGFPGIVLAILNPSRSTVLWEPRTKRAEFLKEVRRELKLPQLEIEVARFEGPLAGPLRNGTQCRFRAPREERAKNNKGATPGIGSRSGDLKFQQSSDLLYERSPSPAKQGGASFFGRPPTDAAKPALITARAVGQHDWFVAQGLQSVREGGLVAVMAGPSQSLEPLPSRELSYRLPRSGSYRRVHIWQGRAKRAKGDKA